MKVYRLLLITLITCALTWGCQDFITKKITNDTVSTLAPANNTTTSSNSITFWWNDLTGATSYNLQIVSPNFSSIANLIADTNVTTTKLLLSLSPGVYQWRVKAVNGGGSTKYTISNLTIDTTSNLTGQQVVVLGPRAAFITASASVTFSWTPILAANNYNLQVASNPPLDITLEGTSYTATFVPGYYTWKVKALNDFSISQYSILRSFKIDQTAPSPPGNLLATSANSVNIKITDSLSWHRSSADVQSDSIYVYSDAGLTILNASGTTNFTRALIGNYTSVPTNTPSVPYWWRVKSIDSAGNASGFSAASGFTLTP